MLRPKQRPHSRSWSAAAALIGDRRSKDVSRAALSVMEPPPAGSGHGQTSARPAAARYLCSSMPTCPAVLCCKRMAPVWQQPSDVGVQGRSFAPWVERPAPESCRQTHWQPDKHPHAGRYRVASRVGWQRQLTGGIEGLRARSAGQKQKIPKYSFRCSSVAFQDRRSAPSGNFIRAARCRQVLLLERAANRPAGPRWHPGRARSASAGSDVHNNWKFTGARTYTGQLCSPCRQFVMRRPVQPIPFERSCVQCLLLFVLCALLIPPVSRIWGIRSAISNCWPHRMIRPAVNPTGQRADVSCCRILPYSRRVAALNRRTSGAAACGSNGTVSKGLGRLRQAAGGVLSAGVDAPPQMAVLYGDMHLKRSECGGRRSPADAHGFGMGMQHAVAGLRSARATGSSVAQRERRMPLLGSRPPLDRMRLSASGGEHFSLAVRQLPILSSMHGADETIMLPCTLLVLECGVAVLRPSSTALQLPTCPHTMDVSACRSLLTM